jgi:hypothetical protein
MYRRISSLLIVLMLALVAAQTSACASGQSLNTSATASTRVAAAPADVQDITLPGRPDTLKFAVIGDSGTGGSDQYRIAKLLDAVRAKFPYEFVIMLGDNLYTGNSQRDYQRAFEAPYKPILDAGIKFYAALGNHDDPSQRFYKGFNMNSERFYTFRPKMGVRFFALDSNYMDQKQLDWLEKELAASGSDWKHVFFHHPIYSSGGRHGSDLHEHFYERIKPQKGIYYFISGGAAKLRRGDVRSSPITAKAFDTGYHFMLIEIDKDVMHFQVISDQGRTVDSGSITRYGDEEKKKLASAAQ